MEESIRKKMADRGHLETRVQPATIIPRLLQISYFPEVSHSVLQSWSTYLAQITVYITDIEVNDGHKAAIFLI